MCYKIVECIETLNSLMEYGLTFDSNAQNKQKWKHGMYNHMKSNVAKLTQNEGQQNKLLYRGGFELWIFNNL